MRGLVCSPNVTFQITGSYVKCPAGRDEKGQTKYRCYLVLGNSFLGRGHRLASVS